MNSIKQIAPDFFVSPQIELSDISQIKKLGFMCVINNRPDGEGGSSQPKSNELEKLCQDHGIDYYYLPVESGSANKEDVLKMRQILSKCKSPVLAFCRSGARSNNLYLMAK